MIGGFRIIALSASALALCSTTAFGQDWPGRVNPPPSPFARPLANDVAMGELQVYANCVVARRHSLAQRAVLLEYGSTEQGKVLKDIVPNEDGCLGISSRIQISNSLLIGALAAALLRRDFRADGVVQTLPSSTGDLPKVTAVEDFGRCVALADTESTFQLLKTFPGTAAESVAIQKLAPKLGPCVQQGVTMKLYVAFVRNATAIALYRLARDKMVNLQPIDGVSMNARCCRSKAMATEVSFNA